MTCARGRVRTPSDLAKTLQGFGQCLTNLKLVIEQELKVVFSDSRIHANRRIISMVRISDKPRRKSGRADNGGAPQSSG